MSKNRLRELDYIRIIACYSVILVHISAIGVVGYLPGSIHLKIVTLLNRSIKYTTPAFLFLSGVTSFYSYRNRKFEYGEFLGKRLPRILIPYLFWNLAYYMVFIYQGYYGISLSFFIKSLFLGTMCYHLYFIVILTQLYFLSPIFNYMFEKFNHELILAVVGAVNFILASELDFLYSDRIFLKYMFFFVLGIYLTKNHDKSMRIMGKRSTALISTAGYTATAAMYTYFYYTSNPATINLWFVYSVFSIFFLYIVGIYLVGKVSDKYDTVRNLSKSSFYIYLMHPLVLIAAIWFADKTSISSLTLRLVLYTAIVIPVSTLSSVAYTFAKARISKYHTSDLFRRKNI
ncbi:Surface polysaccharide O-acyltransferase, integral membrane enzyme [Dethiosulfatibacter aminovorans DSM 17477]|uniref:Surface polysaccharide O-acyltransferase, integral membrane enzyme n=1 Tax=Dethiosulfatibacter aminovorans DSM 17477 TaxID=1121476 RepID=A0A1M6IGY3_9FIRM|nr:acyltransferase [Dethiosulfatibacter aminovorans]SHJ33679.1 Surface polysaccharide O-acyltransferase, integral membrane enzyme [Dethiosulfatibacter aminovorans DSM 17477]